MFNIICNDINSISAAIAICLFNKSNVLMLISSKRPMIDCYCIATDSIRSITFDSAITYQFNKFEDGFDILFSNGSVFKILYYKGFPRQYIYDMVIIDDLILGDIKLHDFSMLYHGSDKGHITYAEKPKERDISEKQRMANEHGID